MLADLDKLVHRAHTTQYSPVANGHVTCHLRIVTCNAIITHKTIMRKVAIRHDQAIFSDHGFVTVLCTTVDRYEFTDGRIVANKYVRVFTLELKILRYGCDNRPREYPAVLPDTGAFHDRDIGTYP